MRRLLLALTLVALAAPAPALAQSAGDNQYQDPFANQHPGGGSNSSGSSSSGSNSSSSGSTSSGTSGTRHAHDDPAEHHGHDDDDAVHDGPEHHGHDDDDHGGADDGGELPRTGSDPGLVAGAGGVLLLAGLGLRLRLRAHPD